MAPICAILGRMLSPPAHPREAERLELLQSCGVLNTPEESAFDDLANLAAQISDAPIALVVLIDEKRQWFKAHHGLEATETPRQVAFCAHAILDSERPFVVEDARADVRFADNPLVTGAPRVIFYAGFPLCVGPDRLPVGTLCVIDHHPRKLTPERQRQLKVIAQQAADQIELRRSRRLLADAQQDSFRRLREVKLLPAMVYQFRLHPDGRADFPVMATGALDLFGMKMPTCPIPADPIIANIHPDDLVSFYNSVMESARTLTTWNHRFRYRNPDGRQQWLSGQSNPERLSDGTVIWYGVITDVTEEQRALEALKRSENENRLLALVAKETNNGVLITDRQHHVIWANAGFTRITGYPLDDMKGRLPTDFLKGPNTNHEALEQLFSTLAKNQPYSGDLLNYAKDGREVWLHVNIQPLPSGSMIIEGQEVGYIAVSTDITTAKVLEERLREALASAQAANAVKSNFLAMMSHEIRTPMNGVLGVTHLLERTPLDPQQQEYLGLIRSSGHQLLDVMNGILDFIKMESSSLKLERRVFDPVSTATETVHRHHDEATRKGLALTLQLDPKLPASVIGDQARVQEILRHLVSNAVKFTDHGHVCLDLAVLELTAGTVTIRYSVRDTGPGMSEEQCARIGSPFTQADASSTRRFGGTGLGLALCTRLLALMGSSLTVTSKPGIGSTFSADLTLPVITSATTAH